MLLPHANRFQPSHKLCPQSRSDDFIRKTAASGTIANRPTEGDILSTRPAAHAAEEPPYQAS
ncbi:TPA: hypothetical protein ACFP4U_001437 [Neisseria lactamica]|uniref:hypothetical protein n=1 Tax=Neisseria lactamica TaxID=486 RepID=UPI000BB664F5